MYGLSWKYKQAPGGGGRSVTAEMAKKVEHEGKQRGRRETKKERRAGLERLLHEDGLGCTANYA